MRATVMSDDPIESARSGSGTAPAALRRVAAFDYASLGTDEARRLRELAEEMRRHQRRGAEEAIAIGERLIAAKPLLPHGALEQRAVLETGLTRGHLRACRRIAGFVADRLGGKAVIVTALPFRTALALASPRTPPEVVDEVVAAVEQAAERGEPPDRGWVERRLARAAAARRDMAAAKAEARVQAEVHSARFVDRVARLLDEGDEEAAATRPVYALPETAASEEREIVERLAAAREGAEAAARRARRGKAALGRIRTAALAAKDAGDAEAQRIAVLALQVLDARIPLARPCGPEATRMAKYSCIESETGLG
jgi:hypothetical protein